MSPSASGLTLMAVHAHPDDEASSTGGVLARYAAEGVRTVLVTCTNGEFGDGPGGLKPEDPGHVVADVVAMRKKELTASCAVLGITDLELLGYRDSGMMGWPQNDDANSFWRTPIEESAARLATLFEKYRPDVVVTYDENGFYGHPDHIQANRITMHAIEATGIPAKLYYPGIPRSMLAGFAERLREMGIDPPEPMEGDEEFGTPDELLTTWVDCRAVVDKKFDSLSCHASQTESSFFLQMGRDGFREVFGQEMFIRVMDKTEAPVPEDDLFAGLR